MPVASALTATHRDCLIVASFGQEPEIYTASVPWKESIEFENIGHNFLLKGFLMLTFDLYILLAIAFFYLPRSALKCC